MSLAHARGGVATELTCLAFVGCLAGGRNDRTPTPAKVGLNTRDLLDPRPSRNTSGCPASTACSRRPADSGSRSGRPTCRPSGPWACRSVDQPRNTIAPQFHRPPMADGAVAP